MALMQQIIAFFMVLVLCVAAIEAGTLAKRKATYYDAEINDISDKDLGTNNRANDLIMRLMDAVVDHVRDSGAPEEEVHDVMRKRAGIRKCFFHAVNCW